MSVSEHGDLNSVEESPASRGPELITEVRTDELVTPGANVEVSVHTDDSHAEDFLLNTLEVDYVPASWPGPLMGKESPPLPYVAKPRFTTNPEEVINFPDTFIESYVQANQGLAGAVSIRGNRKRNYGSSRQDSATVLPVGTTDLNNGLFHLIMVADGVGSADLSHLASREAIISALRHLMLSVESEEDWHVQCAELFRKVEEDLRKLSVDRDIEISRLATTLRLAKVVPDQSSNQSTVFTASVGDGVTYHIGADGRFIDLKFAERQASDGAGLSTATKALPQHSSMFESGVFSLQSGETVVVATDGTQEVWNAGIPFENLLAAYSGDILQVAWALDVRARGATDDRSIGFWRQA